MAPPSAVATSSRDPGSGRTRHCTDQMGFRVTVPRAPKRIVSLVPSQTELLFDLGAGHRVVGVTRYCVHPKRRVARIKKIGGTKRFDFPSIVALRPDLIIGNKEENYQEGIEKLRVSYPVWMSDIETLDAALNMIEQIGVITNCADRARVLVDRVRSEWDALPGIGALRIAYLIWKKPYMAVGGGTFIDDVLSKLGLKNHFAQAPRYPETSIEELAAAKLDVLMLSSEPYPFADENVMQLAEQLPGTVVVLVQGEMFSWYGSRLRRSPAYFKKLFTTIAERRGETLAL